MSRFCIARAQWRLILVIILKRYIQEKNIVATSKISNKKYQPHYMMYDNNICSNISFLNNISTAILN
jgi:hypothetical protein